MEVVGLSDTIAAIQNVANGLINESKRQIKLAGQAYANDVKALSPYDTGTLRRSIHVEPVGLDGSQFYVLVGTDLPYARRLEYGFYDMTDSLGGRLLPVCQALLPPSVGSEHEQICLDYERRI